MSKSEETKAYIIAQAAELFNQKGYAGSSMADIMAVTGLKKGGIYNHFESKEALALAAFDYAVGLSQRRYRGLLRSSPHSITRLVNFIELFCETYEAPPMQGGCPIMNTAIEQDSCQVALRDRARLAMDEWRALLCKIVARGIAQNEIRAAIHPDEVATLIISSLEGGLMLSQLYDDLLYLKRAASHLQQYLGKELPMV